MTLPPAFSLSYLALWALVPGVLLVGHRLARASTADAGVAWVATPAYALAPWLMTLHVVATLAGSFRAGLITACGVLGALGYLLRALRPLEPLPAPDLTQWRAPLGGLLVSLLLVAPLAFGWAFHDEVQLYSHLSTAAQLQNDVYPPRYPTFPAWELRYHYMFNVLTATLSALARLRTDVAIDVVTLCGWAYLWILASAWGRRISGHDAGWLAAPVALLGGGYVALCNVVQGECASCMRVGLCGVGEEFVNPPFLSYLFQHPWGVGLPLGLAALLVASDRAPELRLGRYAGWAVLTFALAFSQFAVCLAVAAVLVFGELTHAPSRRVQRALCALAAVTLALALASRFGGFFAPTPGEGSLLGWDPGIAHGGLLSELRWFGATYGLLLPLGVAGLVALPRERWSLASIALGGVAIIFTLRWTHEKWDVLKFSTLAQVALGLSAGALLGRWWSRGGAHRVSVALLLVALCYPGARFAAPFLEGLVEPDPEIEYRFARVHPSVEGPDAEVLAWLRPQVTPGELVFRSSHGASFAYQAWGGLSVPWTEHRAVMFGFSDDRLRAREALFEVRVDQHEALCEERIVWFVVHPEDPVTMRRAMAAWTSDGRAEIVHQIAPLTVVRLRC